MSNDEDKLNELADRLERQGICTCYLEIDPSEKEVFAFRKFPKPRKGIMQNPCMGESIATLSSIKDAIVKAEEMLEMGT